MQYFSADDIASLSMSRRKVLEIAERTIAALHDGSARMAARPVIEAANGTRFMAFPALLQNDGVAGVKWLGIEPFDPAVGQQNLQASIVLSALKGGRLLAVLDARWITAIRTATVSLVAAKRMARQASTRMAIIACGEQAQYHLDLFSEAFPLQECCCFSRRIESAERLAAKARDIGLKAKACAGLRECVDGADIVVTTSPAPTETLIEPEWFTPGAFISLVDLGRTINTMALSPRDQFFVDDLVQFEALMANGALKRYAPVKALSLQQLVAENRNCAADGRRKVFLPTGLGAIDIAIARQILELSKGPRA
ncbi:MAG: ornithine cyclodeaminase family protein [Mesorhizobium sp.]|nr:MAG: ornithine cyclodeaminase family protein [Mesorhizobium sp.]